jgi:hypothetical protein
MATMPSLPGLFSIDDRLPPFDLQLFGEQPCALALHI